MLTIDAASARGRLAVSKDVISTEGRLLFATSLVVGIAIAALTRQPLWMIPAALLGLYLMFAVKVADQWEKAALLRLGRYRGMRGPGLFFVIPMFEKISRYVDQRIRVTSVAAESALTRDTVPVNVVAIVFWVVWDAEKSILEVEDFSGAVQMSAQTALLESIGRHELAQMITEREPLGRELQRILDEKTNPWGITVQSVENPRCAYPGGARRRDVAAGAGRT
jgi:regulator of protease activity HflC (stomatin/prohibitin superfamily)